MATAQIVLTAEDRTERAFRNVKNSMQSVDAASKKLSSSISAVQAAFAALAGSMVVGQFIKFSDAATRVDNKLKLVTRSTQELTLVQDDLFKVAQETGSAFESTVDLYSRMATSASQLGLSQKDLVGITSTLTKAIGISGASASAADAAILQLGQAFNSGVLRGQEFNSVMSQTPRIAQAIADGLGVATGDLRKLAEQGKLTTDVVVKALQSQAKAIDEEYSKTNSTISDSFTRLENSFINFVDRVNEETGASTAIGRFFDWVSSGFDSVSASIDGSNLSMRMMVNEKEILRAAAAIDDLNEELEEEQRNTQDYLTQGLKGIAGLSRQREEAAAKRLGEMKEYYQSLMKQRVELEKIQEAQKKIRETAPTPLKPTVAAPVVAEDDGWFAKALESAFTPEEPKPSFMDPRPLKTQVEFLLEMIEKADERQKAEEKIRKALEDQRRAISKNVQAIEADLLPAHARENQMLEDQMESRKKMVDDALAHEVVSTQKATDLKMEIQEQYNRAVIDLEMQRAATLASITTGLMKTLADENKELFDLYKAAAIVEAMINAQVAATKAMAQLGVFGPPAAAVIYAAAAARVYQIQRMSYPKREVGGPVSSGRPYLVGERGPELFVPSGAGQIIPNGEGGGPVNVNFNISTVDATGFDQLLVARRGMIVSMVNQALTRRARPGLL